MAALYLKYVFVVRCKPTCVKERFSSDGRMRKEGMLDHFILPHPSLGMSNFLQTTKNRFIVTKGAKTYKSLKIVSNTNSASYNHPNFSQIKFNLKLKYSTDSREDKNPHGSIAYCN